MFGTLGGPELLLILVIALIVFGPRKLPDIGKSMGKMMAEFRKASSDFQRTIEDEVEADKMRTALDATPAELPPAPAPESIAAPPEPTTGEGSEEVNPDGTVRHASGVPEAEHQ